MAKGGQTSVQKIGAWAFVLGVIMAVLLGLFGQGQPWATTATSVLVLIGLIVGLLNVTAKETKDYLIAAAVLVIVSGFGVQLLGQIAVVGTYLAAILVSVISFVVPATVIVSLKEIYTTAASS